MTPARRILLIDGHPDPSADRLNHALVNAYADGATAAGHEVRRIALGTLDFPVLRTAEAWHHGALPPNLQSAQEGMAWAEHVVIFFPLWLGDMPALLKAFLEQVARPGFAVSPEGAKPFGRKALSGRSARVVVTMGMPALAYRWYFRAHSLKSLERNILGFVGFAPIHETLIGSVENLGAKGVGRWLYKLKKLGEQAA
ncbi:NAD(P)H-dependent oxidoreductase [Hydrogenophaga sp. PBL-H3]|uniref:NAD(P)H-dependent oxidoreductase n=1 Tax=Hydrogenophaga sp. PBL-H3 TaxID=434010 RepID=UPI0013202CAC|nr:NAD(P)H-dependent oxidoreductase [Hydrogenophaga sp. PBL-H3]QHE75872.1 NAD(P)H-dependent oxidoreductase [Hydrogenophaga sp. PBL-H3]QHE80297.1 NAD(P)H-dependent oxidoreductase [Hydrogenophaga sp. PBL-H3]